MSSSNGPTRVRARDRVHSAQERATNYFVASGLDPATPVEIGAPTRVLFTGPQHYAYVLDGASHDVMLRSPRSSDSGKHCGLRLVRDFLLDPTVAPADDCVDEVLPLSFEKDPQLAQALFGTETLWP